MIPPFENHRGFDPEDDGDISPMRKFASIAVVVVGVLVVGGLLGWAGGKMLVKPQAPAQTTIAQNTATQNSGPQSNLLGAAPSMPAAAPNSYQTQTLLGLPPVNIPGPRDTAQKDTSPALTDTLGNGNAPPPPVTTTQTARTGSSTDNGPSYGPSSSSGIVLIGPSDKPQPILPPMQHNLPPLNNAKPVPLKPPPQLAMPTQLAQTSTAAKAAPVKQMQAKPAAVAKHKPVKQVAAKPVPHRRGAKPTPALTEAPAAASGSWIVQLGVFREGLNAQDLLARLAHKGETAHMVRRHGMQVVYVPGGSQAAALATAKKLKAKGFDTYVMKGL